MIHQSLDTSMTVTTKTRRHKGSTLISPRDRWAFRWIAEQYAISLEQLQWLLGLRAGHGAKHAHHISESAVRQVLARWQKLGYIEQKNIFTDSPAWIWLSKNAAAELGVRYPYYVPHFATLPHLHAISHVRLSLEQRYPNDTWKPERQIKAERPRYAAGTVPPHTPDGEWQSATTQEVTAIEVELSVKKGSELKRILTDLSTRYQSIWYFALSEPHRVLVDVLSYLPDEVQARVYLYELEQFHAYHPISV
jgi:hypothetical protein